MATFPDVRWGSERSMLQRPAVAFAATHLGSRLIRSMTPLDRRLLLRSRGRYTVLGPIGAPVLLLTTTGAKSGLARTTPLVFARDGDSVIVVGSNFGQGRHPAWSGNLLTHPNAVVTIGGKDIPVTAELLTDEAAEAGYRAMEQLARTYREYRSRTDRTIRVFRLTGPAASGPS
jgi:deazaflavin-dependent oxidoreductase (nitroreductase family)